MEFAYNRGGLTKSGDVTQYVNGRQVGEGCVNRTIPFVFSALTYEYLFPYRELICNIKMAQESEDQDE